MKASEDAYGRELYDYYRGADVHEIVERDDGWIDTSLGPAVYFSDFKDWSSLEKRAMQYARGRILDIGCGAGRHSLYLQSRGLDVLGIDLSPLAVKVCKLRGLKHARVLPATGVSRKLGLFDTILMLGNNFGLMANRTRARWLLKRFKSLTRPGARIIAGSNNPYGTKNPHHLEYHRFNRKHGRMSGQLRIRVRYEDKKTPWFEYLIVSPDEMKDLLQGTGWGIRRLIGPRTGAYIAIIEKE